MKLGNVMKVLCVDACAWVRNDAIERPRQGAHVYATSRAQLGSPVWREGVT